MWLLVLHALMAAFATARLTELLVLDQITAPIRRRGGYLWTCLRCVSVWAGGAATVVFLLLPWLNWPLAFSWVYIAINDTRGYWKASRRMRMLQRKDLEDRLATLTTDRARTREAIEQSQAALQQQAQHLTRIEGAMLELQEMLKSPLFDPAASNGSSPQPVAT